MQDPDPPTGWKPTTSTVAGASLGLAASQIIVAVSDQYFKTPLGPELSSAITTEEPDVIKFIRSWKKDLSLCTA